MRDTFDAFTPPERGRFGDNEIRDDDRVTKSDLVDVTVYLHNDNPAKKAIAVSDKPDTPFHLWKWLPRSLIEYVDVSTGPWRAVTVTLPQRLAHEKGLI
jgi:hypothetical protein